MLEQEKVEFTDSQKAVQVGVPVRRLDNPKGDYTDYGILMCDPGQWDKCLQGVEERQFGVDFPNDPVQVYFLTGQGTWAHEHINPLYLEIGVRLLYGGDERQRAYMRALNAFGEYWYYNKKGTRTEEAMAALEKMAIRTAEAYRNVCPEHDAQENKRMTGRAEGAKKIEDIMA